MRSRKCTRIVAVTAVGVLASIGMVGPAAAQSADDVQQLVDNLPPTGEALADGVQATADTAAETQSAEETSAALGAALVDSGSTLVAGTEQFGSLATAFTFGNAVAQTELAPYLRAIDDPSTADQAFNPEDLATLAQNAPAAAEVLQPALKNGLIAALQGDLGYGTGLAQHALIGLRDAAGVATPGTNYESLPTSLSLGILVLAGATGSYVDQVQEGAAPVFDAAEPLTEQFIGVLEGL